MSSSVVMTGGFISGTLSGELDNISWVVLCVERVAGEGSGVVVTTGWEEAISPCFHATYTPWIAKVTCCTVIVAAGKTSSIAVSTVV